MTTSSEDKSFAEALIPGVMLEEAIEWIGANLEPCEVFDTDAMVAHVRNALSPEDVFSSDELETWAEDNGYTRDG